MRGIGKNIKMRGIGKRKNLIRMSIGPIGMSQEAHFKVVRFVWRLVDSPKSQWTLRP